MARPSKEFRIKKNGDSISAYDDMGYCGSISIRELCFFLRAKRFGKEEVYKESFEEEV